MLAADRNTPPSRPHELHGKTETSAYPRDVFGREMTRRVESVVAGDDRVAFTEACQYPDGTRVLAAGTCELWDGKIHRRVNVQAWDD